MVPTLPTIQLSHKWNHWRQLIRLHTASSGVAKGFILLCHNAVMLPKSCKYTIKCKNVGVTLSDWQHWHLHLGNLMADHLYAIWCESLLANWSISLTLLTCRYLTEPVQHNPAELNDEVWQLEIVPDIITAVRVTHTTNCKSPKMCQLNWNINSASTLQAAQIW